MIRKENVYRDEAGRVVKEFVPLTEGQTLYCGKVRVRISNPMNDKSQVFERDFEFPMTDDITSVEMAFEKFDEICKKRVEERKEKVLKKASKDAESVPEGEAEPSAEGNPS